MVSAEPDEASNPERDRPVHQLGEPILKVEDVHTYYGPLHVLKGVNYHLYEGEIVCLLGGNASGKSTTMKTVLGLVKPTQGQVVFRGERIDVLDTSLIIERGVAVVPEARRIFPRMTVVENLEMGAFVRRRDRGGMRADRDRVFGLFPRLAERRNQLSGTLSGGEQQMLAIARCLMMRPKLIILDEPTEGIMPRLVSQIRREIHRINQSGVSILLVEQNVETALKLCPRVFLMEKGTIVYDGAAHDLKAQPEIVHRYLGVSR
jgi:branched-chain amino acid transport system ATP-binding protein